MMDTTKKILRNVPEYLLYFGAANLVCLLLSFAVNAVVRPLLMEFARGDEAVMQQMERFLWILFAVLFYVVLTVILMKSSVQRSAYLAATVGREYRFFGDLLAFCKSGLLTGVGAYLIFCLPITALVALVPDIEYLPTFFYPQYALIRLTSPFAALALDVVIYAVFAVVLFPLLHLYWEKNRLYK